MTRREAFLAPHALPCRVRRIHQPVTCSATPPRRRPSRPLSVFAALLTAFTPFTAVHAKELRYDGRQELDSKEKAMSLTLTGGTFAALAVWAWKQNRRDDELEEIRIKTEVERLEKLKAEFMDVEEDDDTIDDEDLLASLRERIGEDERSEAGQEDAKEDESDVDMLKRMWDATDDEEKTKA